MSKQPQMSLSLDVKAKSYNYIKKVCDKEGITLKKFMTDAVLEALEDLECQQICREYDESVLMNGGREEGIPWEEVEKSLGLDAV